MSAYAATAQKELPKDLPKAKAALAGEPAAQHSIGYYYRTGKHVEKDLDQAAIWYKKAAEQDMQKSQYSYGRILAFEKGGPRDYAAGFTWFLKANMPITRPKGYSSEKFRQYAVNTLNWYCRAGAASFPDSHPNAHKAECLYNRGKTLYAGSEKFNTQRDYELAYHYLTRAAKAGERKAYIVLAKMHSFGYGRPRNEAEAKRLLRLSGQARFKPDDYIESDSFSLKAQKGHASVHRIMAERYLTGEPYEYDAQKAMMHIFLSKQHRSINADDLELISPILQANDSALLARAHQDALDYAKDYKWPEKQITAITKTYHRAAKDKNWHMTRGDKMQYVIDTLRSSYLSLILLILFLQIILRLALFIVEKWERHKGRPRLANDIN